MTEVPESRPAGSPALYPTVKEIVHAAVATGGAMQEMLAAAQRTLSGQVQHQEHQTRERQSMKCRTARHPVPLYRVLLKDSDGHPTCVVAGPDRRRAWLYVHAPTPTVLRLHPPVVGFLLAALAELDHADNMMRLLPKNNTASYPSCLMLGRDRQAWLFVMAATLSVVELFPRMVCRSCATC